MEVPTLATDRLALRGHTVDDFAACAAMWADPVVTRHIGGRPFTEQETWAKLLLNLGHWQALGFGYWVVEERASGRFVGEIGLANFKRELEPPLGDVPEAGWVLATWVHGRGFATEALRAVVGWADARWPHTACLIDPGNDASVRVAEKCGYVQVAPAIYKGQPTIIYERVRRSAVP